MSKYLLDFSCFLFGRVRGTLGHVMIITMAFFGAITGSAVATVAAIGSFMIPRMVEEGYDLRYAATLAAFGGMLGPIIPPSIGLILYGYLANESVGALFLGSLIPGIILAIAYMTVHYFYFPRWYTKPKSVDTEIVLGRGKMRDQMRVGTRSFIVAIPALIMPVMILGGIFSGIVTATEAGALSATYALLMGLFVYRGLKIKDLPRLLKESANTVAALFIIIAVVQGLNWVFQTAGLPEKLAHLAIAFSPSVYVIMLLIMVIYLFLGCWFDPISILLIMVPLFVPLVKAVGINLIHFGVFTGVAVCAAVVTPPMAADLFVAARMTGLRMDQMYRPLLPFFFFAVLPSYINNFVFP